LRAKQEGSTLFHQWIPCFFLVELEHGHQEAGLQEEEEELP